MSTGVRLAHLLDHACVRHPDKPAVWHGDRTVTFAALRDRSQRLATAFADSGLAGTRLATLLPNGPELLACYLACWAAGVTMVPFEYVDAPPEIQDGLADCGARWLVVHEEKRADLARIDLARTAVERLVVAGGVPADADGFSALCDVTPRALPDVAPETPAFVLYTSGSTALPKGVVHSHRSAAGIVASVLAALDRVDGDTRMIVHDSVSHMGGWIEAFPLLCRGASVLLEPDFDVTRFYAALRTWRPTLIGAHIDHLWQVVRHPGAQRADFASVDTVFTGGDELPLALQRAFMELSGRPIEVGWGMTEAIWLTIARTPELERRGFMGHPVEHVPQQREHHTGRDRAGALSAPRRGRGRGLRGPGSRRGTGADGVRRLPPGPGRRRGGAEDFPCRPDRRLQDSRPHRRGRPPPPDPFRQDRPRGAGRALRARP
jgi:long-chain acyl-CoA synthetase